MEIVKHGKYYEKRKFVCNRCYCEFIADTNDMVVANMSGDGIKMGLIWRCPECSNRFDKETTNENR